MASIHGPKDSVINVLSQLVGLQVSAIAGGVAGVISVEVARQLLDLIAQGVKENDVLISATPDDKVLVVLWAQAGSIEVPVGEVEMIVAPAKEMRGLSSIIAKWLGGTSDKKKDISINLLTECKSIIDKHTAVVLKIRGNCNISSDLDVLTTNVEQSSKISKRERQRIGCLHSNIRGAITNAAQRIEQERRRVLYIDLKKQSIDKISLNPTKYREVEDLVSADGNIRLSIQSLALTIRAFSEINQQVLREVDDETVVAGKRYVLLLVNAIIVYEIALYVVRFYESFRVGGVSEVEEIYERQKSNIESLRVRQSEHQANIKAADADKLFSERLLASISSRDASYSMMLQEWDRYLQSIREVEDNVGRFAKHIQEIALLRDEAEIQIRSLEAVTVLRLLRHNLDLLHDALGAVSDLRIAELSPNTLRLLLRI